MKYFTSEWWESGGEDETVIEKYRDYYSSIESSLPKALQDFNSSHTLHDSNVKEVKCDFSKSNVHIKFRGWDMSLNNVVVYEVEFGGISSFSQSLPKGDYVESELGDLGYWEYEVTKGGIEMRMLFASGAEFSIEFTSFNFNAVREKA